MTTLKITDRDEVIRRALTDAFAPRFRAIAGKLQDALRTRLAVEHPKFLALMADQETRQYVASCGVNYLYFVVEGELLKAAEPKYGERVAMPERNRYFDRDEYTAMQAPDTVVPPRFGDVKISDKKILTAYRKVWSDYSKACEKISALLNSYTQREKLEADFPEFAKLLPPVIKKASLPMVIVADVRRDLAAVGVSL